MFESGANNLYDIVTAFMHEISFTLYAEHKLVFMNW